MSEDLKALREQYRAACAKADELEAYARNMYAVCGEEADEQAQHAKAEAEALRLRVVAIEAPELLPVVRIEVPELFTGGAAAEPLDAESKPWLDDAAADLVPVDAAEDAEAAAEDPLAESAPVVESST